MLLAEQVPLTPVATLQGGLSGERHRGADPDRLLREARPRHPNDGCDNQGNDREKTLASSWASGFMVA